MTRTQLDGLKAGLVKLRTDATDATASEAVYTYPTMKYTGEAIQAGTRIRWGKIVKVAAVTLWDRLDNDPEHAPELWEDLEYRDGIRIIPEVITVAKAFSEGEKGWWRDEVYVSLVNVNVYTPEQYAQNWQKLLLD